MKFERKTEKRDALLLAAGLMLIAVAVIVMCSVFIDRLNAVLTEETDRYLSEISTHVATLVNDRVAESFQELEVIGQAYAQLGEHNTAEFLREKADQAGFQRLAVLQADGQSLDSGGRPVNLASVPAMERALSGHYYVGRASFQTNSKGEVLYVAPIEVNGRIAVAVAGWNSLDRLRETLGVESFGGEGYSHIVEADGDLVVNSLNHNAPKGLTNVFEQIRSKGHVDAGPSLEQVEQAMRRGESGTLYFTLNDGIEKAMNYTPLRRQGWYVLSVVPKSILAEKANSFVRLAIQINLLIIVLFLALIALIMAMNRRHRLRLARVAYVDPVTQGNSRIWFEQEASRTIRGAASNSYAMVSLDIHRFKLINDSFGSAAGDRILKHVYVQIQKKLLEGELLARISADHFAMLFRRSSHQEILRRIEAMAVEINRFNDTLERKYYLPLVAGVYLIDDPTLSLIQIQDRANVARKNNKQEEAYTGQLFSCTFYSDLERVRMIREKEMENRMEAALQGGEFVVYLQPKVCLLTNRVAGAEALVRWEDPERGLVSPAEFIPFFERNGFIVKLDLFVFEEVCALLRKWMDFGREPVPVSVNLSRVHLNNPHFLDEYAALCQRYAIPPSLLEIELTESLVFENLEALRRVIGEIHAIGFQCSLDDFGSGYSSLNILKSVQVDTLKLDKAFLDANGQDDQRGERVIECVIELAKKLHMNTVSEGVETAVQAEFLRRASCDMVQGYVFSRPVPPADFERLAFAEGCPFLSNRQGVEKRSAG